MIPIPFQLQAPFFVVLLGILLSLVFETAGVSEGFRRVGNKKYLTLICALILSFSFFLFYQTSTTEQFVDGFIFDTLAKTSMLAISVLSILALWMIATRSGAKDGHRGEVYALFLLAHFFCLIVCSSYNLLFSAAAILGWLLLSGGMIAVGNNRFLNHEVILKLVFLTAFVLLIFAYALIFLDVTPASDLSTTQSNLVPAALMFVALLLVLGIVPLQAVRVDIIDGSPPYYAAFIAASTHILCSVILIRLVNVFGATDNVLEKSQLFLIVFSAFSLIGGAILAFDQTKISRLSTYLIVAQGGLILLMCIPALERPNFYSADFLGMLFTHFALCAIGIFAGLDHFRNSDRSFSTWEDFSGYGREHPFIATAFLILLSSVSGLPFTSGFSLRYQIIELLPEPFRLIALIVVFLSIIISASAVFRLMAFLLGKAQRHKTQQLSLSVTTFLLFFCACSTILLGLSPRPIIQYVFG